MVDICVGKCENTMENPMMEGMKLMKSCGTSKYFYLNCWTSETSLKT